MNYTRAIFIANEAVRAVKVNYDPKFNEFDAPSSSGGRDMADTHNKWFKSLDPDLKVGDLVIVPTNTRHGGAVCKVLEIAEHVDLDSKFDMDWIKAKYSDEPYDNLIKQEKFIIDKLQANERKKRNAKLRAEVFADDEKEILALPLG